ncbi:hypothetical protein PAXINDRAFT_16628 [Paxillus involutus ATCC 200175]|uniref:Uncharacterized protein n=1 Tax=Paxillus involutus ATCC 200175 TaxID=664439 RepID=A0A0C9TT47_PAXIN|nr:hypothetical protein PAXINDRAFT_16628 [Paxillus involutus ATCC 200175]
MSGLFTQHPSTMFIGLALERSNGKNISGGVFSIGEYDPRFSNVSGTPKHPITPPPSSHWTLAMSNMSINGKDRHTLNQTWKERKGVRPSPSSTVGRVWRISRVTPSMDSWYVPCISQANLSFIFESDTHPVNLMEPTTPVTITDDGKQYTVCPSSFRTPLNWKQADVDFPLGYVHARRLLCLQIQQLDNVRRRFKERLDPATLE